MADSNAKSSDRPQYSRDATWYPLRTGWQSSHIPSPPLLAPADQSWMESVFQRLAALSWPGYMWCAQPYIPMHPKLQWELWGRGAEVKGEPYKWRVSLDVIHFFPAELSVRTTEDGFLEISGKHEERQDDHGFISRSFTRKYKLPIGIEAQTIRSSLSGDGILMVEAQLPKIPQTQMVIPVQLEREPCSPGEAKKKEEPRTETGTEREQERERKGRDTEFTDRKPSPTSPTRTVWASEDYRQGQQADQESAEFSSGPSTPQTRLSDPRRATEDVREAHAHEDDGAREETQDQFTDLSEAPATPDTLTSEQEEASEVAHDREAQQHQDHLHQHQQDGEQREESHEEGDLHREGLGEEMSREQEPEASQFQEIIVPEQEVLEGHMPQEQESL